MSVLFILVKWLNVYCTNRIAGLDLLPLISSYPYILITRYCIGNLKRQKFQFSFCDLNGTIFITVYLWEQICVYPLYSNRVYPLFPRKSGAKETESSRLLRGLQLIFSFFTLFFFFSFLFTLFPLSFPFFPSLYIFPFISPFILNLIYLPFLLFLTLLFPIL